MNDYRLEIDPKRCSLSSGGGDPELGLDHNDQHREKLEVDWEDNGLQVAKLDKLEGWRLWVTIVCLLIGLFMSGLEASIIATALVPISAAFHGGQRANWIVASYFISYTGFLIIFARLSDLFGRKPMHLIAITIFTIFSAACGGAQTITQLIILRSFQGMGAAGLYSLAMSIIPEVTPEKHISYAIGSFAPTFALSSLLGPLLGGIITTYANWRWIFFLNVPTGVLLLCVGALVFPVNSKPIPIRRRTFSFIDFPGMILSLLGVILMVYAIERGGARQRWIRYEVLAPIAISATALIGFVAWETCLSHAKFQGIRMLPLLPVRLITRRVLGSIFASAFIAGFPFMMTTIFLPQRFQLQNGLSAKDAGFRMLPLLLVSAASGAIFAVIAKKFNIAWCTLIGSLSLQILGFGLFTTLPTTGELSNVQYGCQVLLGLGFGGTLSSFLILVRSEVSENEYGTMTGAITQIRILGGLLGIAIAQAVVATQITKTMSKTLDPKTLELVLKTPSAIFDLPPEEKDAAIQAYGEAFVLINQIAVGLCGAALVAACSGAWRWRSQE